MVHAPFTRSSFYLFNGLHSVQMKVVSFEIGNFLEPAILRVIPAKAGIQFIVQFPHDIDGFLPSRE